MEEWRPIPGFETLYAASTQGRIYRHSHRKTRGRTSPKMLKPHLSRYGYLLSRLIDTKGIYHYVRVHRVIAETFIGAPPPDQPEINHLNGDKTDNRVENLVWCSRQENAIHGVRVLGKGFGESHGMAKLTEDQVRAIRAEYVPRTNGGPKLGRKYGVSSPTIHAILQGRLWRHVT